MNQPPLASPPDDTPQEQGLHLVAAFAGRLAGVLRPATVVELLVETLKAQFVPSHITIGLLEGDRANLAIVHAEPAVAAVAGVLERAIRQPGCQTLEAGGGAEAPGIALPLASRRGVAGAVVLGRQRPFDPGEVTLCQALAAQAAAAIEAARLVDLHHSGQRSWEEMVNAFSLALVLIDDRGRVRRANAAFARLVQQPTGQLAGQPWLTLVPPAWGTGLREALAAAGTGREVSLRAGPRTFAVTAYALGDDGRRDAVLLFDDQTERRRLQEQLIQSEKLSAIGQLIAGVAHDLNNPLASVVGFADFLVESPNIPSQLAEPLRVIQQEAERAAGIVRHLLTFARKHEPQRRPTPIKPLLEGTLALLRNEFFSNRIETRLEVEPGLPAVDLDANQIQQVFVNLFSNAVQAIAASGRPGKITVRARRWQEGIAVDVIDDGPGMTEQLAGQAFEPFFTTKPEGMGTGLGLSISQGILKEHGGRIALETVPDQGATFTVELPRSQRTDPSPPAHPSPSAGAGRALHILVVDDEPHILHYMRATLAAWGHRVDTVSDGAAALAHVGRHGYDVIISDLRMPGMGGREFYEALRRQQPRAADRIVFSTGDTIRGDTLAFLESQGRPYLHKPFSLAELRELVNRVAHSDTTPTPTPE